MSSKPSITFALIAYNQSEYIRDAVAGALAQTYEPLEIVLSDDCSTDGTFAIMEAMAAAYAGPHKVILNQNARNLCIGAHINRIMELSSGELVVIAAGDDISFPERTARIVELWERLGRKCCSIYSAYRVINENNELVCDNEQCALPSWAKNIPRMMEEECPGVIGATHAWHRDLFRQFGGLPNELIAEDRAISARALLSDGIFYIEEPLVTYRKVSNSKYAAERRLRDGFLALHEGVMRSIRNDLTKAGWSDHQLSRWETRAAARCEAKWRAIAERKKFLPFVLGALLSGRLRASTGIRLLFGFLSRCTRAFFNRLISIVRVFRRGSAK